MNRIHSSITKGFIGTYCQNRTSSIVYIGQSALNLYRIPRDRFRFPSVLQYSYTYTGANRIAAMAPKVGWIVDMQVAAAAVLELEYYPLIERARGMLTIDNDNTLLNIYRWMRWLIRIMRNWC